MCPPRLNGAILSSSSALPHSAPTPEGPHILCDENARKSQPSACTSTVRCGADCAASTTMIAPCSTTPRSPRRRSEEHTSELQSHVNLVCRLLLEKKKKNKSHLKLITI